MVISCYHDIFEDGITTGTNKVTVDGDTLKADAQYLDGKTIDGAGNITVDTLNGDTIC